MLVLDAAQTRAALPMPLAIEVVADAMRAAHAGQVDQPLRTHLDLVEGTTLVKPAAIGGDRPAVGLKVVSVVPGNRDRGLPTITGVVVALDPVTGVPQALMDGAVVTEVRTAAASAVATRAMAREDAGDLALLGTGVQGRSHLEAMAAVRTLRRVRAWGPTPANVAALVDWAAGRGWTVEAASSAQAAVDGADLVCTTTAATAPVLEGEWLADGCHVNAVGAFRPADRELATSGIARAGLVVVDDVDAAAAEAGDLLLAAAEGVTPTLDPPPVLGAVLVGEVGRTSPAEVTVYESLGLAVQDVAAAAAAVASARAAGLGNVIGG